MDEQKKDDFAELSAGVDSLIRATIKRTLNKSSKKPAYMKIEIVFPEMVLDSLCEVCTEVDGKPFTVEENMRIIEIFFNSLLSKGFLSEREKITDELCKDLDDLLTEIKDKTKNLIS